MENNNAPQVSASEIKQWEDMFIKSVTPSVTFAKKNNGYSMQIFDGPGGRDANWSGTIMPENGDNYIKWTFSIKNEPFIESKIKLTDETSKIITNLYNFYDKWKKQWGEQLNSSSQEDVENKTDGAPQPSPGMGGGATPQAGPAGPPAAPSMPGDGATGGAPVNENKMAKKKLLDSNRERMLRLAQLK